MSDYSDKQRTIFVLLVNIIGGLLVGYIIGYVPVALTFQGDLSNCTKYTTSDGCSSQPKLCAWKEPEVLFKVPARCGFVHEPALGCGFLATKAACASSSDCYWQASSAVCAHNPEWSQILTGVYAGMMIIGGMIGSFPAGMLLAKFGRKKMISFTGFIGVLATIFCIIGWQINDTAHLGNYGLMVVGRLLAGIAVGLASCVCPMYCGEMAPPRWASAVGCSFQVSVTFGIFFAALLGFIIDATGSYSENVKQQSRFQIINAMQLLFGVLLIPVGSYVAEPSAEATGTVNHDDTVGLLKQEDVPLSSLKTNFMAAIALAAAQQLTGINAVMNYAPDITTNFGLPSLRGNVLVMAWNFVTTIASIKIATLFSTGTMYVGSATIASLACLLTAIPIFPSVFPTGDKVGYGLTGAGVFIFVAAFEMGMGPAFYVLAQSIFPASRRSFGCSFTVVVQFIFNLIINFCFPVAVQGISGGPDEDQRKGMAVVFVFFGVIGIVCTFALFWNLRSQSRKAQEAQDGAYAYAE